MKILFDQGTPAPLRAFLSEHVVQTAFEMGWSDLINGALLKKAEASFDLIVTTDKNLKYQQNLKERKIAILVLPTTNWPRSRRHTSLVKVAISSLTPADYLELQLPQ